MITANIQLHSLTLEVSTHSQQLMDWLVDHYLSSPIGLSDKLAPLKSRFTIHLELAKSTSAIDLTPPANPAFAEFYIAGEKCYFADQDFWSFDHEREHVVHVDVKNRIVRANIGARLASSQEVFCYQFIRELFKRIVFPTSHLFALHGAVVAKDGVALFLAGHSGSGKTTTALKLWQRGFSVLADDSPLFFEENGASFALSSLEKISVTEETLSLFPSLRKFATNRREISGKYSLAHDFSGTDRPLGPIRITHYVELSPASEFSLKPLNKVTAVTDLLEESLVLFRLREMQKEPLNLQNINALAFSTISNVIASASALQLSCSLAGLESAVQHLEEGCRVSCPNPR